MSFSERHFILYFRKTKSVEPNQNLGQKVRVRFGFGTLMGPVQFEFYICLLHASSGSVWFFPKGGF